MWSFGNESKDLNSALDRYLTISENLTQKDSMNCLLHAFIFS